VSVWVSISEAARLLGVSVDTVKRRIAADQLRARREVRPQGFRWIVELPADLAPRDTESAPSPDTDGAPLDASAGPSIAEVETEVEDAALMTAVLRAEVVRLEEMVGVMASELDKQHRQFAELLHWLQTIGLEYPGGTRDDAARGSPPPRQPGGDTPRGWRLPWRGRDDITE